LLHYHTASKYKPKWSVAESGAIHKSNATFKQFSAYKDNNQPHRFCLVYKSIIFKRQVIPRFVLRGVIDNDSLPLNVSREILQQSKQISTIKLGAKIFLRRFLLRNVVDVYGVLFAPA
jgi:hypothetical protein